MLIKIAISLWLTLNPVGNSPLILSYLKDYPIAKQRHILLREAFLGLVISLFFYFAGDYCLDLLALSNYAVSTCGGVILFTVAFQIMNTSEDDLDEYATSKQEPFLVPIATPMLSGPATLTMLMLIAKQQISSITVASAITVAWVGVGLVLFISPSIKKLIGDRGLFALGQVMGMLLLLMSCEMLLTGLDQYLGS